MGLEGKKPYIVIIVIQIIYAGLNIFSKAAFNGGMSTFVFVFYRQVFATIFFVPFAMAFGRKNAPPLPLKMAFKIFLLAFIGITFTLNILSMAIKFTSATVSTAGLNTVPVITFFLAVVLRMETVKIRSISGISKITGVLLCIAGILVIAFYEGPHLKSLNHHHPILHGSGNTDFKGNWIIGTFLLILATTSWSLWIVLQGLVLREYTSKILFITMCSFFTTIQSFLVGMAFERDFSKWKPHLDQGLLAAAFAGIFASGIANYLQVWCIEVKGPVFIAMSNPLAFVITLASSSFLLGEIINLGSVLGGLLMVGGLYSVLWGKSRETKGDVEGGSNRPHVNPTPESADLVTKV